MNYRLFVLAALLGIMSFAVQAAIVEDVQIEIISDLPRPELSAGQQLKFEIYDDSVPKDNQSSVTASTEDVKVLLSQKLSIKVGEHNISDDVAQSLIDRRKEDNNSFESILKLSAESVDRPEDKELFARELLSMDRLFVMRICNMPGNSISVQAKDYVKTVQTGIALKVRIDDDQVKAVYNDRISLDDFLDRLYGTLGKE
jgi:hypothetical protein